MTATRELVRTPFTTSRGLDFFSEEDLTKQMGYQRVLWPVALLKELIDNALDACESATVLMPKIEVEIGEDFFSVADSGPGIPPDTIKGSLDYSIRISDKSYYVSPTRGLQGNALKTLWAAPYVFTNAPATIEVEARGVHHTVTVSLDRIAGEPKVDHSATAAKVKSGTFWRVAWPAVASYLGCAQKADFYSAEHLLAAFSAVNQHAQFVLRHSGRKTVYSHSGDPWRKWFPNQPTSPHWYRAADLQALIAAYVHHADDRGASKTVRQFVGEFYGLTGSKCQTKVVNAAGLAGQTLADMVEGDDIDAEKVSRLLAAMQAEARLVKPEQLGIVGKAWFTDRLVELYGAAASSIRYKPVRGWADGLPFVLEVGFAVHAADQDSDGRNVVVGLNWSPAILCPIDGLTRLLGENRVDTFDDVTLLVHLAYPRLNFRDRGKASLTLPDEIDGALMDCICSVTKEHRKEKRRADRDDRLSLAAYDRLRKASEPKKVEFIEAAYKVMEEAYRKVSGPNNMPANARQIMYVVRPLVIELTGGNCWKHSSYFTQTLLPNFIKANPELTADWDVVFDARGKLVEPHTGRVVNLGTIGVREYISEWTNGIGGSMPAIQAPRGVDTCGPANRFRFALFVEKEGFGPHLEYARIAERFDVAIMSTKGMSVTACRRLVEELSDAGVTILVLRDFDVSGFSIVHTMRNDTRRYQFKKPPKVIDLGLRLADAQKMGLQDEQVNYGKKMKADPRERLARCGATEKEQAFLVSGGGPGHWIGRRIELNAMSTPQFIEFVERSLRRAGAEKIVPNDTTLRSTYRLAMEWHYVRIHSTELVADARKHAKTAKLPDNLAKRVLRYLKANPAVAWDEAIAAIVEQAE